MQTRRTLPEARQKPKDDPLAIPAGGGGESFGEGLRLPGARCAAALEMLRGDFESRPLAWTSTIKGLAARALSDKPGASPDSVSMVEHFAKHMPAGQAGKGIQHLVYAIAINPDAFGQGEWKEAKLSWP